MKRLLLLLPALALAACAGLKSTLPAAAATPDYAGTTPASVAPAAREAQLAGLQAALDQHMVQKDWGIPLQLARTGENFVRLRLGADEAFETGTATLSPRALLALAEFASTLQQAPASVVHVLVHGADPGGEPATRLSSRRAASVQSYLLARGVPATRVRAEGRDAREPVSDNLAAAANWRVDLVVRPVVTGAETEAWMPPRPDKP